MRVVTILGPSQSGKSTLAEALAGLEGRHDAAKVADHLTLHRFGYLGDEWLAIDVAGGPDHLPAAARALTASDAAVVVAPPDPEAAALVSPYLRLLGEAGTPSFILVNRMDAAEARVRDVVASLQDYAPHPIVLRQIPIREGGEIVGAVDLISERAWKYNEGRPSDLIELPASAAAREQEARTELLEHLADHDDALLEELIEDRRPATDEVFHLAARVLEENEDMPAFLGAASHANGVVRLMKCLRHETPGREALMARLPDGAVAVGFAGEMKKHMGKTTYLRALRDGVGAGATLGGESIGALSGLEGKALAGGLAPGDVGVAAKADHLSAGRVFDAAGSLEAPDWARGRPPTLRRLIRPANERDDARLGAALTRLAETDAGLGVSQDERTGAALATLQGPMHERRLKAKLAEDFGIEVAEGPVEADCRETIARRVETRHRHRKQSGGAGQFADVAIVVEPQPRGAGFEFAETVKGGAVPKGYIPAVAAGAEDALASGPLGRRVIDVKVTLTDGKHHSVDSSDYAFRTAGSAAVREALRDADPVLLQPILKVAIHTPSVFSGALVALVSGLKGQVLGFEAHASAKGWDVFNALLPGVAEEALFRDLAGATQGTAWFEAVFDHYEEVYGREAERFSEAGAMEPA